MNNLGNKRDSFANVEEERKIMLSRSVIKENVYRYYEEAINIWLIVSWAVLLLSYSFFIVASTLFYEAPAWLEILGSYGIYISIANFFVAVFVILCYIVVWFKEREYDVIKTKMSLTLGYNLVSLILYFTLT